MMTMTARVDAYRQSPHYSNPEPLWGMPKRKSIPYLDVLSSVKLTKLQLDELHTECFNSEYIRNLYFQGVCHVCPENCGSVMVRNFVESALLTVFSRTAAVGCGGWQQNSCRLCLRVVKARVVKASANAKSFVESAHNTVFPRMAAVGCGYWQQDSGRSCLRVIQGKCRHIDGINGIKSPGYLLPWATWDCRLWQAHIAE